MNLKIITNEKDSNTGRGKLFIVDMETGFINGSDRWIFSGFYKFYKQKGTFVPLQNIDNEKLKEMGFINTSFINDECKWKVRDIDCGTNREWGASIQRVWISED